MKKTLGLAIVGGLLAMGIGHSQAQSTNGNTVQLQTLNIALSGFAGDSSGNATPVKIGSKDIINSLMGGTAAKGSKLALANNSDGSFSVLVVSGSGKNVTATDVSSLFSVGTLQGPVTRGKTSYTIDSFSFGTSSDTNVASAPITFTVQGFTTSQSSGAFNSKVNGGGTDNNGNSAVLQGTISASAPSKSVTVNIIGGGDTGGGGTTNTVSSTSP